MKTLFLFLTLLLFSNCTIIDRKVDLYSNHIDVEKNQKIETEKFGPVVKKDFCNRVIIIIPLSNKNQFDVIDDLIAENSEYNALANFNVKSDFISLFPFYGQACHRIEGQLVKLK